MVLEFLQKYDSIEKQENAKEYVILHTSIKGIQFSHAISALAILTKGVSKIAKWRFLNQTSYRKIFITSSFIGMGLSQGLTYSM